MVGSRSGSGGLQHCRHSRRGSEHVGIFVGTGVNGSSGGFQLWRCEPVVWGPVVQPGPPSLFVSLNFMYAWSDWLINSDLPNGVSQREHASCGSNCVLPYPEQGPLKRSVLPDVVVGVGFDL